jgi:hypothetical protein
LEILEFLLQPFVLLLISIPMTILVGIIIGTWLSQPRKPRVIQIAPESGRGREYDVESEDNVNAYCHSIENEPPQRFIKRYQALNILRKGWFKLSNYALWFARQGTAYTYKIDESKQEVKITLREAILNLFGPDLFERIPNDEKTGFIKDRIEKSSVGVTIEFPAGLPLTPKNPIYDPTVTDANDPRSQEYLPSISSDDIRRNDFDTFINAIVRGVQRLIKGTASGEWVKIIFIMGTGIGIGIVLSLIFHWGAPVVVPPST